MTRSLLVRPTEIPRPILYYNFNNDFTSGSTLRDVMGTGDDGAIGTGVTTSQIGRTGQAYLFDNSANGVVSIPDSAVQVPHQGASGVSTWHIVFSTLGGGGVVCAKQSGTLLQEFTIILNVSNEIELLTHVGGTGQKQWIGAEALSNNTLLSVTVTYDNTLPNVDKARIFINGVEITTTFNLVGVDFAFILDTAAPLEIGSRAIDDSSFQGAIDELLWFDKVLTDEQIAELSARSLREHRAFAQPPVTDYSIWWSARDVDGQGNASIGNDTRIQTLVDHGSIGANATQASAAKRPILVSARNPVFSKLNNLRAFRPGLRFDGVDDILDFASQNFDDVTAFVLSQPDVDMTSASAAEPLIAKTVAGGAPDCFFGFGSNTPNLTDEVIHILHNSGGGTQAATATSDPSLVVPSSRANVITFVLRGTENTMRLNGVDLALQASTQDGALNGNTSRSLRVVDAIFGRDTIPAYHAGTLFELFLFARGLSDQEVLDMESFLAEEYPGLESQALGSATASIPEGEFEDPFAFYSFDNSDLVGTTLLEPFGAAHGTLINTPTTGVTGQTGQAFSFTAASLERVEIVPSGSFDFDVDKKFSISSWFSTSSSSQWLVAKLRTEGVIVRGWGIFITAGGNLQVMLGEPTVGRIVTTTAAFNDGIFHNVIVTYDGTNSAAGISIFVDGAVVSTSTTLDTDPGTVINGLSVQIGSQDESASIPGYWTGLIDETAFWDTQLT